MSDEAHNQLVENVLATLTKNGYPDKLVALPLDRMYEVAHTKGLNFNKVLSSLAAQGVAHTKESNRIIFSRANMNASSEASENSFGNFDIDSIPQGKMKDLMEQAAKMMGNMSAEEMEKVMSLYQNMSAEEREELAKKATALGLMT